MINWLLTKLSNMLDYLVGKCLDDVYDSSKSHNHGCPFIQGK